MPKPVQEDTKVPLRGTSYLLSKIVSAIKRQRHHTRREKVSMVAANLLRLEHMGSQRIRLLDQETIDIPKGDMSIDAAPMD